MSPLGQQRLLAIVGRITQRPETWDQTEEHRWTAHKCGTAHCVMGHAEIDAGHKQPWGVQGFQAFTRGKAWLELTSDEACWLYDPFRTLAELQQFAITGVLPEGG